MHGWKNCIYGVNDEDLAGETKAVYFQSELVVVVQVLFLALSQVTCAAVEESSCHGNGAPTTSLKSFNIYRTEIARDRKFYENNFQNLSCSRELKTASRIWSTSGGTRLLSQCREQTGN